MKPQPTIPIFSFFISVPAVGVPDSDHYTQHVGPRLRVEHHCVREHAAIPADMSKRASNASRIIAHPGAGVAHNVELAVGIERLESASGLVMRARPFHRAVILRHMKIEGPGTQSARHGSICLSQLT